MVKDIQCIVLCAKTNVTKDVVSMTCCDVVKRSILSTKTSNTVFKLINTLTTVFLFYGRRQREFSKFKVFLVVTKDLCRKFRDKAASGTTRVKKYVTKFVLSVLLCILNDLVTTRGRKESI